MISDIESLWAAMSPEEKKRLFTIELRATKDILTNGWSTDRWDGRNGLANIVEEKAKQAALEAVRKMTIAVSLQIGNSEETPEEQK